MGMEVGEGRNRDLFHISLLKTETCLSDSTIGGRSFKNLITQRGLGDCPKSHCWKITVRRYELCPFNSQRFSSHTTGNRESHLNWIQLVIWKAREMFTFSSRHDLNTNLECHDEPQVGCLPHPTSSPFFWISLSTVITLKCHHSLP